MINFLLIGESRSGSWPIASLLNTQHGLTCHDQAVNHHDIRHRMLAHYSYFGVEDNKRPFGYTPDGQPMWPHPHRYDGDGPLLVELDPVLAHYIERTLFPVGVNGETHIGVRLTLETIARTQFSETLASWCRRNTAAVIYVDRNPFDCYVSHATGIQRRLWTSSTPRTLIPIRLDPRECTAFVESSLSNRDRVLRAICQSTDDYCLVQYRWLFRQDELQEILGSYLRLPEDGFGAIDLAAIHPYPMRQRVSNYDEVKKKVSSCTRDVMNVSEAEDELFFHKRK